MKCIRKCARLQCMDYFLQMKCLEVFLFNIIISSVVFLYYEFTFVYSHIYYKISNNFSIYVLLLIWGHYCLYAMLYSYFKACFKNPGHLAHQNVPQDADLSGIPMENLDEEDISLSNNSNSNNINENQIKLSSELLKVYYSEDSGIIECANTSQVEQNFDSNNDQEIKKAENNPIKNKESPLKIKQTHDEKRRIEREQAQERRTRWCLHCNSYKIWCSHHCSICNTCVVRMDHHCPWIMNCVGYYNHRYFLLILMYLIIGGISVLTIQWRLSHILSHSEEVQSNGMKKFTRLMALIPVTLAGALFSAYFTQALKGWTWIEYISSDKKSKFESKNNQANDGDDHRLKLVNNLNTRDNVQIIFGTRSYFLMLLPVERKLTNLREFKFY